MTSTQLVSVFTGSIQNIQTHLCNAQELHNYLKVETKFADWISRRISEYGFIENEDFITLQVKTGGRGRARTKYHITLDMGKELAMVERNEKGRQIRKYFIECEKHALAQSQPRLDTIASPEQKQKIKNAVSAATHLTGKPYQYVYTMLFNYLGINELAELKAHDFARAMRYIDNWDFQSPKQSLTTPPATRLFPNAGRYLVVTDHNGNITRLQQLQDESIVNAEAYRKLRQDMYATENLLKELRCRMTMVEGQASLSRLDTPILTSVNQ